MRKDQTIKNGRVVRLPYRCPIDGVWYDYGEECRECVQRKLNYVGREREERGG